MNKATRMLLIVISAVALFGVSTSAFAVITYTDLGTTAPPASLGSFSMSPFDVTSQAAIADYTAVTTIPGSPIPGSLAVSGSVSKRTVPDSWATWSHGYTGPVFMINGNSTTMTLPPGSGAFYFYAEPDNNGPFTITATTDSGTTSGPVSVYGSSGATGFGFYAGPGESIATITVTTTDSDFAIGEFGISHTAVAATSVPTMNEWGMIVFMICAGIASIYYMKRRKTLQS
jgi:hypothetical protein